MMGFLTSVSSAHLSIWVSPTDQVLGLGPLVPGWVHGVFHHRLRTGTMVDVCLAKARRQLNYA